jgi:putative sterol carrier protein
MADDQAGAPAVEGMGGADASQLAAMVGQASDEQLAEGMSNPEGRKMVLDEIFKRMGEHVEPSQVEGVDAVVHFKITDAPGGGEDTYEVAIKDGSVKVSDQPTTDEPKTTISAAPVPFLKLVTGQQSGPVMFMTGKLKIQGDLMFASRMTGFFRIPSASA